MSMFIYFIFLLIKIKSATHNSNFPDLTLNGPVYLNAYFKPADPGPPGIHNKKLSSYFTWFKFIIPSLKNK